MKPDKNLKNGILATLIICSLILAYGFYERHQRTRELEWQEILFKQFPFVMKISPT